MHAIIRTMTMITTIFNRLVLPTSRIVPLHLHGSLLAGVVPPARGRDEIDEEGEDVEGEDEGYDPFEDGGDVVDGFEIGGDEDDGEDDFNQDEEELDPEGNAEVAVLAEMNSQPLILSTGKDGRDDIARDEQEQENIMKLRIAQRIEYTQQDQPRRSDRSKEDGEAREHFLRSGCVRIETAAVPQPSVREKGYIKEEGRDAGAGDEERLEFIGAYVGDIGNVLA